MKYLLVFTAMLIATATMANNVKANEIITGKDAEVLFTNLKGYEYSTGAINENIEYRLIVRHNESLSCQKETTLYPKSGQVETVYSCELK